MKTRNFVITIVVLLALSAVLLSQVRGLETVTKDTVDFIKTVWGSTLLIILLCIVFIAPCLLGILSSTNIFKIWDNKIDKTVRFSGKQKLVLSLLEALIVGAAWLILIPILVSTDWSQLRQLWIQWGHWEGGYESAPVLWGVYAFLTLFGSFWFAEGITTS